jgi:hypothetical protein
MREIANSMVEDSTVVQKRRTDVIEITSLVAADACIAKHRRSVGHFCLLLGEDGSEGREDDLGNNRNAEDGSLLYFMRRQLLMDPRGSFS